MNEERAENGEQARWFVLTWSPHNGIAFAQCRKGSKSILTVALAPPTWKPLEVSPATARRAERDGHQVGFYGPGAGDGPEEIAFDSLQQLVQVVRQAFVSAGGAPPRDGTPATWGVQPGPNKPSFDAGAASEWLRAKKLLLDPDSLAEQFAAYVDQKLGHALDASFQSFSARLLPANADLALQDPIRLAGLLQRMGLLPTWRHTQVGPAHLLLTHLGWPESGPTARTILQGLLFRVPAPSQFRLGNRYITTLGDALTVAMSSRGCLAKLTAEQFAVVLFAATLLVSATGLHQLPNTWSGSRLSQIRYVASAWLHRERPKLDSTTPAAAALDEHLGV